jgi:hypothetical protein
VERPNRRPDEGDMMSPSARCTGLTCKRISLRGKTSPLYKYKGPRPMEVHHPIDQIYLPFYCLVFTFTSSQLFQSTTCCSSFVSVSSEDVLGGLADPRATLRASPWRDPARATFGGLPPEFFRRPVWPVYLADLTGVDAEAPRQLPLRAVGSKRCQQIQLIKKHHTNHSKQKQKQ